MKRNFMQFQWLEKLKKLFIRGSILGNLNIQPLTFAISPATIWSKTTYKLGKTNTEADALSRNL